jgi:N-acetyl-anhydromuramyl-L-alanine amidase AmpD
VNRVFIHCSASDNSSHDDVKVIRTWHLEKGWLDIGYHFFIKKDGTIQEGRDIDRTPAAQKGHNTETIAICLHGLADFTPEQFSSLKKLCNDINRNYNSITFHGHCEVNSHKTCPVFDYKTVLNLNDKGQIIT